MSFIAVTIEKKFFGTIGITGDSSLSLLKRKKASVFVYFITV